MNQPWTFIKRIIISMDIYKIKYIYILQIPGASSTIQPGNYNCDSCNIVYLLMCDKCDSENYIGETSNKLRFRLNNHEKSIRDNSRGFQVAVKNLRCVILRGDFKTTADRLICEQMFMHKLKTVKRCKSRSIIAIAVQLLSPVVTTFSFYVCQQHRILT